MIEKDVIIVGSGGAGMTAAVVAAHYGLKVLVVEKTGYYGGTTALSGGGIWAPASDLAKAAGIADSEDAARRYVKEVVGPGLRADLLDAYLAAVPRMAAFLQENTAVQFEMMPGFADWRPEVEGASDSGRLLTAVEYDGRELGDYFSQLRVPLAEFNAPGGFMFGLKDMAHITQVTKSFSSFIYMARLVGRFAIDRISYPRGARLTMGNALAARLLRAALDGGVELWRNAPVERLIRDDEGVRGVVVRRNGEEVEIAARRGVVLATGGFSADAEMRARYIPYAEHHVSLVAEGNTGDGLRMAVDAGGVMEEGQNASNGAWIVISLSPQPDGGVVKFPHLFMDRGKPGCIAVNAAGRRFGNEAAMDLVEAMHASGSVPAHLVCDHRFIRKYGLGLVKPGGFGLRRLLDSGYLMSAPSLAELAGRIGADARGLQDTVARFNTFAVKGEDPDFGKGGPVDYPMGDMTHEPNPCLGPVETPPFYAVKIFPGDSTTTAGLRVDAAARVLDREGRIIPGLHACGLDMNSLWRGRAPGNGAYNGPSMTFGYLAAMSLVGSTTAKAGDAPSGTTASRAEQPI